MGRPALRTSDDYFREVLTLNRDAYFEGPVTFASAFNLASSLFHFHEWLFVDFQAALRLRFAKDLLKPRQFWKAIEATDLRFGYVKDVANASKHVLLDRDPSTGLRHIKEATLNTLSYGAGAYGVGRYSGPNFIVQDGTRTVSFDECSLALFDTWRSLLNELAAPAGS